MSHSGKALLLAMWALVVLGAWMGMLFVARGWDDFGWPIVIASIGLACGLIALVTSAP